MGTTGLPIAGSRSARRHAAEVVVREMQGCACVVSRKLMT